jgi:hypothetical protein
VLEGVGVVGASHFEKLFEVLCGCPHLTLAAIVIVGHSLLATLLAPLLATLGVLLGIMAGDIGRQFPDATWGWARLSSLVADGMPSGGIALLLGGVQEGVGRFLETS